jgi:hypothetical protein
MQAAGGKGSSELHSSTGHKHIPGCWAIARSGIPPREPLFNGTICRHPGRWGQPAYSRGFTFGTDGGVEQLDVRYAPLHMNVIFSGHLRAGCLIHRRRPCEGSNAWRASRCLKRGALYGAGCPACILARAGVAGAVPAGAWADGIPEQPWGGHRIPPKWSSDVAGGPAFICGSLYPESNSRLFEHMNNSTRL